MAGQKYSAHLLLMLVALLGSQFHVCHSSAESDANSVEIKLYPASLSDWPTSTETTFASTVADQATVYCGASPAMCGLDNGNTFGSADVIVHSKSEASRSLKLSVYVNYPQNSNVTSGGSTTQVLPAAALKEILKAARDAVKSSLDLYITYIGSDYYGVPPESTANGIIIPIAAVTVVAVGISTLIMVYAQESREKKEKLAAKLAKKRTARPAPNYNIPEIPNNSDIPIGVHPGTSGNDGLYQNSQTSQALHKTHKTHASKEVTKETSNYSAAEALSVNHFHTNGDTSNLNNLPPLSNSSNMTAITYSTAVSSNYDQQHQNQHHLQQQQDRSYEETEEEERKKRKKEKKREKKRLLQEQRMLQQQQQQLQDEGLELHDNQGFDTSAMTISENSGLRADADNIPTFTVQRKGDVA
ncbi:DNA damage-regulated autophagy modulator protein 2 [Plakobranchus ocellatus]|uniref:DNA damage-regulated autophagy modulator protein 2 n=1 Tax=Plakobranchus ocellatus TaxID=259542 RepID=A0AAV4DLA3_9GAST|nr:DNA damage-regulated autophagy modulator protein 2 [Plakobranchus ocellatus]